MERVVIWAHPYIESSWFRNVRSQFSVGHFSKSENSRIAAGWVPSVIFPLSSELLARSREIRRLRVIVGAVLDDQLTRLCSGFRRTERHTNRALRFGV